MPELDALFDPLRAAQPPAPFAAAVDVRRRGQRRAHRHRLAAAGGAALAVSGLGVGTAAVLPTGPGPVPPPRPTAATTTTAATASAAPSPTRSLPLRERLLQPADLGSAPWRPVEAEAFDGPRRWFWEGMCPAYEPASPARRTDQALVSYRPAGRPDGVVTQILEEYAPGWATRNLADVRAAVERCGRTTPPPGEAPVVYTVEATELAGDESLLVRIESYGWVGEQISPEPVLSEDVLVVRVGDRVTTLRSSSGVAPPLMTLVERAVRRLR
jgi:hypothetical protein